MNSFFKLLILLIKNKPIFSYSVLRKFRNFLYRRYYQSEQLNVADRVTISTAHSNKGAFFKAYGQVNIGSDVYIDYSGGVSIYERVAISEGAKIFTHNHNIHDGAKDWMVNSIFFSPLKVEKYAWIGADALILASVQTIGEGSVVAAGAVLTKSTEPYGVYGGNPAKKIGHRRINEK